MSIVQTTVPQKKNLFWQDDAGKLIPVVSLGAGASYEIDAARGAISGRAVVQKFGQNTAVATTGTGEDVWSAGGDYTGWIQSAVAVRIKAGGNAADTALGLGARSVTIEGLDENWTPASETVATAGGSASAATTTTFIRVFRAFVAGSGTYGVGVGSNTGTITIETTGGVVMAQIEALAGQSEMALYTTPSGVTAYMGALHLYVGVATKTCDVSLYHRLNADTVVAPFGATRVLQRFNGIAGYTDIDFHAMPSFPARTDIWIRAISQTQENSVSAAFDLFLVDD